MGRIMIAAALALSMGIAAQSAAQAPAQAQPPVPAPAAAPEPAPDWSALARQDVLAAYDIYARNHPGMHDPSNPSFPAQLARGRDRALAAAAAAQDQAGYARALGLLSAELGDGHAQVFAVQPQGQPAPALEWPGFVAAWRGDRLLVHQAGEASPAPVGAAVTACNGLPIRDYMRERLLTRGFRPAEAGQWWFRGTQVFVAGPASRAGRPERCTFRAADGRERDAALAWSPAPATIDEMMRTATDGERTPIGMTEPRPGLFLIGMPDFQPNEAGVAAYRALYELLRGRRADLLGARAVVIDLRHNNGGSSGWSRDAAEILWGEPLVERTMADHFHSVAVWWRASPDTIAYMTELEQMLRGNGRTATADSIHRLQGQMEAARVRGEPFHVEPVGTAEAASGPPPPPSDFTTPVYVITPGRCASACLDALDVFTRFPNVRLIGAPTSADSTYMEVRSQLLPSQRGRIVVPTKIWMGRPRRSGEVYAPHIPVDALDWSTGTFLDRIEQDLGPARG